MLLAAADSIVVIGYSFPETDLQSSNLFCNAFLRRQTMPNVHIVDPAPERVTGKFQN
jgi:thiamine pyrophosphate-dependent acetolactate synthase large subunit-like protein